MSAENPQNPEQTGKHRQPEVRHMIRGGRSDIMGALAASGFMRTERTRPPVQELSPEEITRYKERMETADAERAAAQTPPSESGVTLIGDDKIARYDDFGSVETAPLSDETSEQLAAVKDLAERIRSIADHVREQAQATGTEDAADQSSPRVIRGDGHTFGTIVGGNVYRR